MTTATGLQSEFPFLRPLPLQLVSREEFISDYFSPQLKQIIRPSKFVLLLPSDHRIWGITLSSEEEIEELYQNLADSLSSKWSAITNGNYTIMRFTSAADEIWFKLRYGDNAEESPANRTSGRHPFKLKAPLWTGVDPLDYDRVLEQFRDFQARYLMGDPQYTACYIRDDYLYINIECLYDLQISLSKFVAPLISDS